MQRTNAKLKEFAVALRNVHGAADLHLIVHYIYAEAHEQKLREAHERDPNRKALAFSTRLEWLRNFAHSFAGLMDHAPGVTVTDEQIEEFARRFFPN